MHRTGLALALVLVFTPAGNAAVRICKESQSSGLVRGQTELEATKQAMDIWRNKASAFGEPFTAWRIASEKLLKCLPLKEGGYECLAKARPCTIEQAPKSRELRQKRLNI